MTRISGYTALATPAAGDLLPIVDVSDQSMAPTGTTKAITYGALLGGAVAPAVQYQPANPTGSGSSSLLMMGLGSTVVFTPLLTGKVRVEIRGLYNTAVAAAASVTLGGRYAIGSAPANGAAVTGSSFGTGAAGDYVLKPGSFASGQGIPFTLAALLALTPGSAYWFDIALATGTPADAAQVFNLTAIINELAA